MFPGPQTLCLPFHDQSRVEKSLMGIQLLWSWTFNLTCQLTFVPSARRGTQCCWLLGRRGLLAGPVFQAPECPGRNKTTHLCLTCVFTYRHPAETAGPLHSLLTPQRAGPWCQSPALHLSSQKSEGNDDSQGWGLC